MKHGKISHLLSAALLSFTVGNTSLVYADDTEIYLNSASAAGAANILFSLDTSGSMSSAVDENNNGTIDSGERSRMEVLKEAMITVLDSLPPLNAGLMRFHYYGGPILYPVANIDEYACVIEGNCTPTTATTGIVTTTNVITNGNDDVELEDGTTMVLDRVSLNMGERAGGLCTPGSGEVSVSGGSNDAESDVGGSGYTDTSSDLEIPRENSQQQVIGMRFQNVGIPRGATVTDARIEFTVDSTSLAFSDGYIAPIDIIIVGENLAGGRGSFSSSDEPEDRLANPTSATVDWETGEFPGVGQPLTTENLSAILNELVNDAAWPTSGGDDMVFLMFEDPARDSGSTGSREVESANSGPAPKLTFTYEICGSPSGTNMRTGLRFTDIDIPQGSTVTGARIDFINTTAAIGSNPTFVIKAENADDAAPFAVGSPFTSRTFTSGITWDTGSTPALGDWTPVDSTYSTPDLTAQVQSIINRSGWCGGNDLMFMIERTGGDAALRTAYSVEGDSQKAPVLTITFDADSNPTGCARTTIVNVLTGTNNDVEEDTVTGAIDATSSDLEMVEEANDQVVGLRFTGIPIAKNTTITSAKITFTADEVHSGATSLTLKGQKSADAEIFSTNQNNVTNTTTRPRTTASVSWAPGTFAVDGELHDTPDLTTIIQEIVNQNDWAAGNDLAIFVSGSGKRVAQSFDRNPAAAPRLTITFEGEAATVKTTVRQRLKGIVEELTQASGTPISGAMLEAAYYYRGEDVVFGRQRGTQSSSYRVSRVSHAASYNANGATVTYPGSCSEDNLNHTDCSNQVISGGDPEYKSPIISECQSNYLVQLTDGGGYYTGDGRTNSLTPALSLDEQDRIEALQAHDDNGNLVTLGTCDTPTAISATETFSGDSHNECTVKLAKFLHENDQIYASTQNLQSGTAPIADVQSLDIYNIGFNLCGNGNVTAVDDTTGESICCAVGNSTNNGDGTRSCSSPITDPERIKVLKAQSAVGGGKYFNANTVDELVAAFTTITNDILQKDTSFVAPSIAANAFNRLFSRDEVFFGLFEPAEQPRWDGNVKKYNVCVDPDPDGTPGNADDCRLGDVLDANGVEAIVESPDPLNPLSDDGLFSTAAQSEWSDLVDGRTTKLGGAGGEIDNFTERTIYTDYYNGAFATSGQALSATGFKIDSTNWDSADAADVRDQVCADPTDVSSGSDCEARMLWMLGKNTFLDPNPPAVSTGTRWWFQDVLHSSPVAVTYGQNASQQFIDKVLVGTNDGGLHFINGTTGEEEWVFMPRAVLSAQPSLYDNTVVDHIYGMDSTPILYITDANTDGTIDPAAGDSVKVVISQRRGGDNIYALDLTPSASLTSTTALDSVVPKFLWSISGATPGFAALGQTWSEPALVTLDTSSGPVSAFVFGGGYDENLDEDDGSGIAKNFGAEAGAPNAGNAIYIVNAETGDLIFSVNGDSSTPAGNIYVPEMQYSIPSNVTVFDSDGDGFEDRLYVGDTAGQLFRVDLTNVDPTANDNTKGKGDSVVGILARVSTAGTLTKERRFFYKPSVVQVIDTEYSDAAGGEYDYVLIGTGNRANPLDTEVQDRFYGFRDVTTGLMADANSNNIADSYPLNIDATANGGPIVDTGTNPELIDVSTAVLDPASDNTIPDALGWYIDFATATSGRVGEKVLAGSGVFQNILIFTTYVPDDISVIQDPCKAAEGSGFAYNFNILSTAAALDWDADDPTNPSSSPDPITNRAAELGSGIPSEAVPIFTAEGVTVLVGTGGGAENLGKVADLPRFNTYWYEE
jgi:type IV pilus assembly protein PilY1